MLRRPAFYLLMIGSMCSIAAVGGANQHLKLYLSLDHAYTQGAAAGAASLTLAARLAARLSLGWLAGRRREECRQRRPLELGEPDCRR